MWLSACSGGGGGLIPHAGTNGQQSGVHGKGPRSLHGAAATPALVQKANGSVYAPNTVTVTYGSAPASGDVLVVFFHNNGNTVGNPNTYTAPAGWTQIDVDTAHGYQTYQAFYHVAGASEPTSYSFTPSCLCREHIWNAEEFSGINTTTPIDRHGFTFVSNSTSWVTPSETPSQAGDLAVVAMLPTTSASLTWTSNSAGFTVDMTGETWAGETLEDTLTTTSPVSESSTLSASSSGYGAIVLLNPGAGGPPPTPTPTPGTAPNLVQKANNDVYNPTTVTVNYGSVPSPGDVLVVFFHNNGDSSGNPNTYTAPSGWTQIDVDTAHGYSTYQSFYHVAGASEPTSYNFTPLCACKEHVWNAEEFSGVNNSTPIDRHGFTFINNSTSWVTPSETPTQGGDLAVVAMLPTTTASLTWSSNSPGFTVDITGETWAGETLHEALTTTSPVSESSTLSGSSFGYSAIVLLNPGTSGPPPTPPAKVDWPTWGMKPTRNSYNPVETTLTTANVGQLQQLWSHTLGGVITDAPVVAANVTGTSEGTADVLYIGDAHANFYALDANTGTQLWSKTLQTTTVNESATGCYDQPGGVYGIGGSQTIDRASSLVYLVDGVGNLYAYDLATGNLKVGPVPMWPDQNQNGVMVNITNDYGALNEDATAGVIYVPSGAHCGLPNYGGMHTYSIASGTKNDWYTEGGPPNNTQGGVWGPGGAVIDPRSTPNPSMNNIYFGTAYGPIGAGEYPYSVVRLTEALGVVAANNPITKTCCPDLDFGDTPLVFTPSSSSGCTSTLVAAESKDSKLFVFNADAINSGPIQTIQLGTSSEDGENLGTAAYYPPLNMVYIGNGSDSPPGTNPRTLHGLIAYTVTASCQLSLAWQVADIGPNQVVDGPPAPVTVANGILYYSDGVGTSGCSPVGNGNCSGSADFYAFNASSGAQLYHTTLPVGSFTEPVVVNGKIYLTSWNGQGPGIVYCYGLPGTGTASRVRRTLPKP